MAKMCDGTGLEPDAVEQRVGEAMCVCPKGSRQRTIKEWKRAWGLDERDFRAHERMESQMLMVQKGVMLKLSLT